MTHRSRFAALLLLAGLVVPAASAHAQSAPTPNPAAATRAEANAAIVRPLTEIGRVRARTPFCGALARARPGIDAAIAYEYAMPTIAQDLRGFRLDSYLTKEQSLTKAERDLSALWDLAIAGRADVVALRAAANAEGDEQKRKEMLAFANALDGAKARQMGLARSIAKLVGTMAEQPVRLAANQQTDDQGPRAVRGRMLPRTVAGTAATPSPDQLIASSYPQTSAGEDVADHDRLVQLFGAFALEDFIRDDLGTAAKHGTAAMQLGGCGN